MQASRVPEGSLRPRLTALSAHGPYPLLCPPPTSAFFSIIPTLPLLHCEICASVSVQIPQDVYGSWATLFFVHLHMSFIIYS